MIYELPDSYKVYRYRAFTSGLSPTRKLTNSVPCSRIFIWFSNFWGCVAWPSQPQRTASAFIYVLCDCIYIHTYICINVCLYTRLYVSINVAAYVRLCDCVCCMHVGTYICMYVLGCLETHSTILRRVAVAVAAFNSAGAAFGTCVNESECSISISTCLYACVRGRDALIREQ